MSVSVGFSGLVVLRTTLSKFRDLGAGNNGRYQKHPLSAREAREGCRTPRVVLPLLLGNDDKKQEARTQHLRRVVVEAVL